MPQMLTSATVETAIGALQSIRRHNDEWGYQWGRDIQNQIYARIDAALNELDAYTAGAGGEWDEAMLTANEVAAIKFAVNWLDFDMSIVPLDHQDDVRHSIETLHQLLARLETTNAD